MTTGLKQLVYSRRAYAKRALRTLKKVLPTGMARHLMRLAERAAFTFTPETQTDTLPPAFLYWAKEFVVPKLKLIGGESPEELYFLEMCRIAKCSGEKLAVASMGAGLCEVEIRIATRLRDAGINFTFECIDLNAKNLALAEQSAKDQGLNDIFSFRCADLANIDCKNTYDVIVVNQVFHHIDDLEGFCSWLKCSLRADGILLTSDVVGRNGHLLWPDVSSEVQKFWKELPAQKRVDRSTGRSSELYLEVDHSSYSNEGVRAQDIVSVLNQNFEFDVFLTYGSVVIPFIERRVGFNFQTDNADDIDFINRVTARDEYLINSGSLPASNVFAVLTHPARSSRHVFNPIAPEEHILLTNMQLRKV